MQTNNTFKVEASKDFETPVDQLYAAWTQPEQLKKWWKPMTNSLTDVTNDLKEGGTVKYVFQNNLTISGTYEEVKEAERLVYSWDWHFAEDVLKNANYKLTVEFKSNGNGSSIKVLQDNFQDEEGTLPHQEGWNKGLEDLHQYLSEGNSQTSNTSSENNDPKNVDGDRSGGYNEAPEQTKVGGA